MDNLIIMNTIIENQSARKLNTYMFFADAVKCFDKLWLKDCIRNVKEMYNLGYDTREQENSPGQLPLRNLSPRQLPSGQLLPGQLPPRAIAPQTIST